MSPVVVAVSYCHSDGKSLTETIARGLRDYLPHVRVIWDREIRSPASLQTWILDAFSKADVVILVLTHDYVEHFGRPDSPPEHRGVQFESKILLGRYYELPEQTKCLLVPVADVDLPLDNIPLILKIMVIHRVDQAKGTGFTELYKRVADVSSRDIDQHRLDKFHQVLGDSPSVMPRSRLREARGALEAAQPSGQEALGLVESWLALADPSQRSPEFVHGFLAAERIIKAHGDHDLMRRVVDVCLDQLSINEPSTTEKQLRAQLLIHGRSWHLRREGDLPGAIAATEEGINLAGQANDYHTKARGARCRARINRKWAETGQKADRADRLSLAKRNALEALDLFNKVGGSGEIATSLYVLARVEYAHFRLLNDKTALRRAKDATEQVRAEFPQDLVRDRISLLLLRVDIHTAMRRFSRAHHFIDQGFGLLENSAGYGASYEELRARAHLCRARLLLREGGKNQRAQAFVEAQRALDRYKSLGLHADIAEYKWILLHQTAANDGVCKGEIAWFERNVPNAQTRYEAAHRLRKRIADGSVRGRWWRWWHRDELLKEIVASIGQS